jgi:hypothetical protein
MNVAKTRAMTQDSSEALANAISFFDDRGALARLVLKIYEHDELYKSQTHLNTRKLLEVLGSNHGGQSTLRRAYNLGYVKRDRVKRKKGEPGNKRGYPATYNSLTDKGRNLAEHLIAIPYHPSSSSFAD